jgi:flagellar M-ring protein FliF
MLLGGCRDHESIVKLPGRLMATEPNPITNQFKLLNEKLTLVQKMTIGIFGLAILAALGVMVYFMGQEDYQTLYSSLNAEEAGTVIAKLKDLKVPYQLADSGKTIKVPATRVDELKIQLASEGLPQSGKIGFEIFDKTNLGMTEFLEKVSYKRALEGELARTIQSLKEISQVRVHLVLPKESLFQEKSEPTKASVVVKLNSGKQLNETMVSGIVHLVSSAVEGLDPQNVTVVDSSGRLLSAQAGTSEEALTNGQMELKGRAEKDLINKVVGILEPIVGQGKVKANASVVLDFSRSEQTEEKYDPQTPTTPVRSQQRSEEGSGPAGPVNGGIPGTTSNQAVPAPKVTPIAGGGGSTSYRKSELTNYEIGKLVRHTVNPFGEVKKMSVAVIVDDAVKVETAQNGTQVKKPAARSADELRKLKDLVAAAIGVDNTRGDLLTVENIAFDNPFGLEDTKPTVYEKWKDLIQPAIKYGAFLLLFLLVYMLLIRPVTKKVFAPVNQVLSPEELEQKALAEGPSGPLALEAPKTVKELEAALEAEESAIPLPKMDLRKADILKQRILEMLQKEPENGAQLLRVWLSEEGKM